MLVTTLAPYRRALSDAFCRACAERGTRGRCCRSGDDPCVLTAHTEVLVDTVTRLGRGATPDELGRALGRQICTICPKDAKGYCSLDELLVEANDAYLTRLATVILDTQDSLGVVASRER